MTAGPQHVLVLIWAGFFLTAWPQHVAGNSWTGGVQSQLPAEPHQVVHGERDPRRPPHHQPRTAQQKSVFVSRLVLDRIFLCFCYGISVSCLYGWHFLYPDLYHVFLLNVKILFFTGHIQRIKDAIERLRNPTKGNTDWLYVEHHNQNIAACPFVTNLSLSWRVILIN